MSAPVGCPLLFATDADNAAAPSTQRIEHLPGLMPGKAAPCISVPSRPAVSSLPLMIHV